MQTFEVRVKSLFCGAILWFGLVPLVSAQDGVFEVDPAATRVEFTLGAVLHTVHGTFQVKSGSVRVDPSTGKAGGLIVVDAVSGESGNRARDRKMHRDILESQTYPEVSFAPVRASGHVSSTGESHIELQGILKLHGVEHEITATVSVLIAADRWKATVHFTVPYVQWGLKNPSTFILRVGNKVDIDVFAQGRVR